MASADGKGVAYLVPLSFDWDGEAVLMATPAASPTGRNLSAAGTVRLGLGTTRDVTMIEGDVEDIPTDIGRFDCLVAADVLEHLVDPWAALDAYVAMLGPGCRAIVSLPNVAHWSTFARLAAPGGFTGEKFLRKCAADLGAPEMGVEGTHVFTFNQVEATEKWRRELLEQLS